MNKFYVKTDSELRVLISNAADIRDWPREVVEKDYWVSFLLDYIFSESKWSNSFTFKGGTSLSKCFNLIERFSEDIDLILDWKVVGYENNEPYIERTKKGQNKFNTALNEKTIVFLKDEFVKTLNEDLNKYNLEFWIDPEDPNSVLCSYPKLFSQTYLTKNIKLEIGCLGKWTPAEDVKIKPLISEVYPDVFKQSAIIRTISPERTFWEKTLILHSVCNKSEEKPLNTRYARHYYDLYCLYNSIYKKKALDDINLLLDATQFKKKFYWSKSANYDDVLENKNLKLIPDDFRIEQVKKDYVDMKNMFYGHIPSIEQIFETLKKLEVEINDKLKTN
ncbi:nucleotidyl transferase AbiEii/AbiGii toxin family protein [Mycoplasma mycoides subsp. capri]|uniref:nucleotidyl transferase AbiEii/AbiGii toxin family protein n=1 Tax=Mycoplasma mycoides TaxID=2102 RepID=UPI00223F502D|nr:nucleotidyl transferase AbiEii/AbiGii toxin family protein [Mycoplasma mycoides]UZK64446.1 nucleotidyl transferase AbiEii/AbiGii toxin family protein [Mycoplasma mycoides subsp. capri]